jgi:hypothetical protein
MRRTITAHLAGTDTCTALDITAEGGTPVLALCRKLIEAGHHPTARLNVYRGETLALRIRSIGQAAQLRVGGQGVGSERASECGAAPPMRQPAAARIQHPLKKIVAS